ncbi:RNA polymerase sigma factor [Aliiglaciecola sp. CAU 1673]|uniref:RNA polymerase sigma factor n=1 Tax=Aliiglaciecola sp. CAU 1673 TaxID=3032595 RepID=UPI0023DCD884|nr:RNA polymerase sigma factor [Aliiglaciecola sp. CAU 1673]MDF2176976.1 RNA polymerase sigma factor [Aliiglaciecola sp. CAU 1673]
MFEQTDEKLISKALDGHQRAWLKLVRRYEKPIYNYGLRMTGNADDAMDLMQEVFMSVFRNLASYRAQGSFKSWLFSIAHFRCVEFYRRRRHYQPLDEITEPVAEGDCVSEVLNANGRKQELIGAMQSLPLEQKAVLELKFFGQFTFEEIAAQLGVSSNTVKSRLYAALGKLKVQLEVDYV